MLVDVLNVVVVPVDVLVEVVDELEVLVVVDVLDDVRVVIVDVELLL